MAATTIYPTGTTIYNPDKSWNGFTLFTARETGAVLADMNGNTVHMWKGLHGFPSKMLPDGFVMGSLGTRDPRHGFKDRTDVVQVDWDGNVVWKFDRYEFIEDPGYEGRWMARQHHDYQREGNPVGYPAPGMLPYNDKGNTLILGHKNVMNPAISDKLLVDDVFLEVSWKGEIIWEWILSDHFEAFDFSDEALKSMRNNPNLVIGKGKVGDWMHVNSLSTLGPNRWFDAGDKRFHPDNIIWDARQTNIAAITDKASGEIVWQIGPDYTKSTTLRNLSWVIGQHHVHMIPKGLPGEGNILMFDNGGRAGYGAPNPGAPTGHNNAIRDYSRVLEFDPITLEIVWQYSYMEAGYHEQMGRSFFYSPKISSAQRLANGNTLITVGSCGRMMEITADHELVWEYISPYYGLDGKSNYVYRAYRIPYGWVPQLVQPEEIPINRIDNRRFRVPGSPLQEDHGVTEVIGAEGFCTDPEFRTLKEEDEN